MATINIPGRIQGQNYHLREIEGSGATWMDLTFQNDTNGKFVEVKLSAEETYRILHAKTEADS